MAGSMEDVNPLVQAFLNGSAAPPPPGIVPNLIDPPSIGIAGVVLATTSVVIATIVLAIRVFTKLYLIKAWHLEDYLIIPAWGVQIFFTAEVFMLVKNGAGIDLWNLTLSSFLSQLYYINSLAVSYSVVVALIKVAILVQLLRIFVPYRKANPILWWTTILTIAVIVLFYIIITGFLIWACNPRDKIWNPLEPGDCFDASAMYEATGVFNIISDFAVFIIPIFPVWKLHLPRGKRLAIIGLFATGLLDCVTSIVRTYETWVMIQGTNVSHDIIVLGCWAAAELGLGVVVCCLPVMPRFLQFLHPRLRLASSATKPSRNKSAHDFKSKITENEHSDVYPMTGLDHNKRDTGRFIKVESCINVEYT